ncbi:MAG: ThiF family adenylyltransferase [Beutenbergiaceae bacterium]
MNPLVAPGPPLTAEQASIFSRHLLLSQLGEIAQRRLLAARVAVVGAGGLGSPALLYLAAAGVGVLGIIDDDEVEASNLHRQIIHGSADVGRSKIDSASERLRALTPNLVISTHHQRLDSGNAADILSGYDLVLDGTDNFATRYAVSDACASLGIPLVWGSVLGFDAQMSVFWPGGGGPTLRDLFPVPPAAGTVPSCAEAGVLGSVTGQVGSVMATEAIKLITGVGEPLIGRVLTLNALDQRWREVPLRPAPSASTAVRPSGSAVGESPAASSCAAGNCDSISVLALRELQAQQPVVLVDVRNPDEVAAGKIPGALTIPVPLLLTEGGRARLPRERQLVAYCQVGPRAQQAVMALADAGFAALWLEGGYPAWESAQVTS